MTVGELKKYLEEYDENMLVAVILDYELNMAGLDSVQEMGELVVLGLEVEEL